MRNFDRSNISIFQNPVNRFQMSGTKANKLATIFVNKTSIIKTVRILGSGFIKSISLK